MACLCSEFEHIDETYGFASDEMFSYWERDERRMCMLPDGHDGPHEFVLTSEIMVTFRGGDNA